MSDTDPGPNEYGVRRPALGRFLNEIKVLLKLNTERMPAPRGGQSPSARCPTLVVQSESRCAAPSVNGHLLASLRWPKSAKVLTMFALHPCSALNQMFLRRPYQGADPQSATFLFVGLDANYAVDIENSPIFDNLLTYHDNGPAFWRSHGLHHPFLLPQYKGDGRRYHRAFAKIGFQPRHADLVSFVELLHVPTVGRNNLDVHDLCAAHLRRLHEAIFAARAQFIFVSAGVQRLLRASGLFSALGEVKRSFGALKVLYEDDSRAVFLHLHLSNYGRFEEQLQAEAREIGGLIRFCDDDDVTLFGTDLATRPQSSA